MTEKEQIELISRMIQTARNDIRKGEGFPLLLWGYIVAGASTLQYVLLVWVQWAYHYAAWLLILVALAVSVWHSRRQKAQRGRQTYVDSLIESLWVAFSISLSILGAHAFQLPDVALAVILLFYALALFVTGRAFKFRPLQWGAGVCWLGAGLAFHVPYEQQLLVLAASVLLGYIVPGHLINRQAHV